MTITSTTSFFMFAGPTEQCVLRLVHHRGDGGSLVKKRYRRMPPAGWIQPNVSEIRIDSLVVESIDAESNEGHLLIEYNLNHSSSFRRTVLQYNKVCSANVAAGAAVFS